METNKSLWEVIKGTIKGIDNEGSAKRATTFYTVVILITLLDIVFSYKFYTASTTEIDKMVIDMFPYVLSAHLIFAILLLGLATIEMITNLIKVVKGYKEDVKQ